MKTRSLASRPVQKPRTAKLIPCGPARKWTREELLEADARFMREMGPPSRTKVDSTAMLRAGR